MQDFFLKPHLIVNFELLDNGKFQKHPERCGDHGVIVQGEVVKVELIDAELTAQGDLGSLGGEDRAVSNTAPGEDGRREFNTWIFSPSVTDRLHTFVAQL